MHAASITPRLFALGAAASVAVVGAIAFTGLAVEQTASAGTNGQQINFCTDKNAVSVKMVGINDRGDRVEQSTGLDPKDGSGCHQLPNFWWKGPVAIHWEYTADTSGDNVCFVPETAPDDYTTCTDGGVTPITKRDPTVILPS